MNNVAVYALLDSRQERICVTRACEFWLTFAEDPELVGYLQPLLDKVTPVLLDCMVCGTDDLLWLDADVDDASLPDKDSDIKPRYHSQESHEYEHESGPAEDKRVGAYGDEVVGEDVYDGEYGDDFNDEMSMEWDLRKCSVAALDVLAVRYGADLLNMLLGPLKDKLWSSDWLQRESVTKVHLAFHEQSEWRDSLAFGPKMCY